MLLFSALLAVLVCIFFVTAVFYFWGAYNILFGEEDFETSPEAIFVIANEIRLAGKEKGVLYDLGSCWGSFALRLQVLLPELRIICIDHSLFRVIVSRVRSLAVAKRPVFLHGDLFSLPMDDADIINIYLPREMLPKIQNKISTIGREILVTMYRISFADIKPLKAISLPKTEETVTIYLMK